MKTVEYHEDLCKSHFVITVLDTQTNQTILEKRRWVDITFDAPDFESLYHRQFDYSSDPSGEKYKWLSSHSVLVATAAVTPRWTDREWQAVA